MTDRYENIRRALADMDAAAEAHHGLAWWDAHARFVVHANPDTIRELLADRDQLAAALEAAREDANLVYRMIPTLPVTPETCEQATDALTQFCLSFHATIDQARGKAGQEVGK